MATGDQSAAGEAAHQAAIDWVLALHESPAHAAAFEQARQTWLLTGRVPPGAWT